MLALILRKGGVKMDGGIVNERVVDLKQVNKQNNTGSERTQSTAMAQGVQEESFQGNWDQGTTPVNNLRKMKTELQALKREVGGKMHQDTISEEEIQSTLEKVDSFKQNIDNLKPEFEPPALRINIDVWGSPFAGANTYIEEESGVKWGHSDALKKTGELREKVENSLRTPGSSSNEIEKGWFGRKHKVDDVVNNVYEKIEKDLTNMETVAAKINQHGPTTVIKMSKDINDSVTIKRTRDNVHVRIEKGFGNTVEFDYGGTGSIPFTALLAYPMLAPILSSIMNPSAE